MDIVFGIFQVALFAVLYLSGIKIIRILFADHGDDPHEDEAQARKLRNINAHQ